MKRPYRYTIECTKTKTTLETNIEPRLDQLQTWEPTNDSKVRVLKQTKLVYIDTRYEAKLRLFNYLTYTKNSLEIPIYKPFEGTEIGKTIPMLNF
jgi:hypothetical protein